MKKMILLLVSVVVLLSPLVPSYAETMSVQRIHGGTRYETAVEISKQSFSASPYALIASGENFPDALGGGPLAIQLQAPILLVGKNSVPAVVTAELERLGVTTIYLAGGESVISAEVETSLKSLAKVERISGMNRYETNLAFLPMIRSLNNAPLAAKTVHWHVNGTNFPDALAAAPLVAQMNAKRTSDVGAHFLTLQRPGLAVNPDSYAIGGPSVVAGEPLKRIHGATRYETAVKIAQEYPKSLGKSIDTIYLSNGENFPDALAASPLISKENAALLLTTSKSLSPETKDYLITHNIKKVVILGGFGAVSQAVQDELESLYKETPAPEPDDSYKGLGLDYPYVDEAGNGLIKGNISAKNEKIYHVPGMRDYNRTQINTAKGERWFKTEREAREAGWRMPLNH